MRLLDLLTSAESEMPQRIWGVVIGKVTNCKDPAKLGRVKVQLPWLSDSDESDWARVASPMAGKNRGLYFLPEVNDEVLIAFEQGDPRFPYVLGGLWNGKDPPPEENSDGKSSIHLLKSRSGHTIRLNDQEGKETIEIIDKSGKNRIVIDTGKNTITINSQKDIVLAAPQGKIKLDAQALEFKTSADIKIEAGTGMNLKASGSMNCKGATINLN